MRTNHSLLIALTSLYFFAVAFVFAEINPENKAAPEPTEGDNKAVLDKCCVVPGDANNDGNCNIGDQVFLINYIFRPDQCAINPPIGCSPDCLNAGDANYDCHVNIGDAIVIGNFVFSPGAFPDPECGCVN